MSLWAAAELGRGRATAPATASSLILLIEAQQVVAMDPLSAKVRWHQPLRVAGHVIADEDGIVVPVEGEEVVGLDVATGEVRFRRQLVGDALTGLALTDDVVVASVLEGRSSEYRSAVVGISRVDGAVLWKRPSLAPVGIPDGAGATAIIAVGGQVIALRASDGKELARIDLPRGFASTQDFLRVTHGWGQWLVGNESRWVALGGGKTPVLALAQTYAPLWSSHRGIDPGYADSERLRLWVRHSPSDDMPRDAILLAHDRVVAFRLDREGQPLRARWVHREAAGEFVAMEIHGRHVVLVREDGAIVTLHDDDGRVVDRIAGGRAVRGALLVGPPARMRGGPSRQPANDVDDRLGELLRDEDPRALPVQRLAVDLLWRSELRQVRERVVRLASGARTEALRQYAHAVTSRPWGSGTAREAKQLVAILGEPPDDERSLSPRIRDAIALSRRYGDRQVAQALGQLLERYDVEARVAAAILDALATMETSEAFTAPIRFLRQHCADSESSEYHAVVRQAAQLLLSAQGRPGIEHERVARQLAAIARDDACDRRLRAFIWAGLPG